MQQIVELGMPVSHVACLHGIQPACCLSAENTKKEISLLLQPVRLSFLLQSWQLL